MIWAGSLARYLTTEKKVSIVEDLAFGSSNKVFSAVLTQSTIPQLDKLLNLKTILAQLERAS